MKQLFFFVLVAALALGCSPKIYEVPNFSSKTRSHDKLAVLPFNVDIQVRKLPKDVTQEMINEQEESNGYALQADVYSYFLRQMSRDNYTVEFQDVDKTNALLKEAGVSYDDLRTMGKDKVAKLLGVDGIVSGSVSMEKPMSDGAAIAIGVIAGVWATTNKVNASLTVHDQAAGDLLWKYDFSASGSVRSSTKQLSNALMRNASKRFPYRKA